MRTSYWQVTVLTAVLPAVHNVQNPKHKALRLELIRPVDHCPPVMSGGPWRGRCWCWWDVSQGSDREANFVVAWTMRAEVWEGCRGVGGWRVGLAWWKESWAAANWHAVTGPEASLSRNMHEKHMSKHCYTEPTKTHVSSFTEHVVHAHAHTRLHSRRIIHPSMLDVTSKKNKNKKKALQTCQAYNLVNKNGPSVVRR